MLIEAVEYKKLFHLGDRWGVILRTVLHHLVQVWLGVCEIFVRHFFVMVGELCSRSWIKKLAKRTCCISYHSKFPENSFSLTHPA